MSRKRTADEWEQRARTQEERARQSRKKAREQRIAEGAKVDAEILLAVKEWR